MQTTVEQKTKRFTEKQVLVVDTAGYEGMLIYISGAGVYLQKGSTIGYIKSAWAKRDKTQPTEAESYGILCKMRDRYIREHTPWSWAKC